MKTCSRSAVRPGARSSPGGTHFTSRRLVRSPSFPRQTASHQPYVKYTVLVPDVHCPTTRWRFDRVLPLSPALSPLRRSRRASTVSPGTTRSCPRSLPWHQPLTRAIMSVRLLHLRRKVSNALVVPVCGAVAAGCLWSCSAKLATWVLRCFLLCRIKHQLSQRATTCCSRTPRTHAHHSVSVTANFASVHVCYCVCRVCITVWGCIDHSVGVTAYLACV